MTRDWTICCMQESKFCTRVIRKVMSGKRLLLGDWLRSEIPAFTHADPDKTWAFHQMFGKALQMSLLELSLSLKSNLSHGRIHPQQPPMAPPQTLSPFTTSPWSRILNGSTTSARSRGTYLQQQKRHKTWQQRRALISRF